MRPEENRPRRLQQGKSRARILLKKYAGWLPGFPREVRAGSLGWQAWPWEIPGIGQTVWLDREAIRRLEMTLTKLRHHFPLALPQIVEDVDDWLARMDCLLEAVKGAIHEQRNIDVGRLLAASHASTRWIQRYRQIRAARPQLAALLDAVTCLEFTGRARCDLSAFEWIDEHATTLGRLVETNGSSLDLQLTLCTLRADIPTDALHLMLKYLSDASICSTPIGNVMQYAEQLSQTLKEAADRRPFEIPARLPRRTMSDAWHDLLEHLLGMKPKARRQAATLLELMLPGSLAAKAPAFAAEVEQEESRLLKRLRQIQFAASPTSWKRRDKKRLKEFSRIGALQEDNRRLFEFTEFMLYRVPAIVESRTHVDHWVRLLNYLPADECALRLGLFVRWEQETLSRHDQDTARRRLYRLMNGLCRLFARRGVHPALLVRWRKYVEADARRARDPVADLIDSEEFQGESRRRWFRLVEATVYDRNLTLGNDLLGSLEEFARATPDVDRASQVVAALAESEDDYYCENEIRAAFAIAGGDSQIAAVLQKLTADYKLVEPAALLAGHLQDERLRRVVERWVLAEGKRAILRLATCTRLAIDVGASVPELPNVESPSQWRQRYPAELREPLAALQRVTPDAREVAAQLLSKEFPDPEELRRELVAVREKLDAPGSSQNPPARARLRKRLENLRGRIDRPPTVTPQRLENLAQKIADRVEHELVERYVRECQAKAARGVAEICGIGQLPDELFSPPNDLLLSAVLQLEGRMRQLGLQLLLKIQHDPTCDFRSEPANARFLKALADKGLRLEPWLDRSFEVTARTDNGEPYRVFFAREILDVLLMGFHFDTCLSPDSFNFFSTVANAVDVNKQVVYGKTESGRVIGRCLFVLADSGVLLTYNRYAHNAADGFETAINQFAERLARAMGTTLDSRGQVPTLVANRWYDDGAVPNKSLYDLQNPDGRVRTILRTEDASRIVPELLELFASPAALKSVLGGLLFLDEFRKRKEIVEPLVDLFAFDATVPLAERFRLAILARYAGRDVLAEEIVRSLRVNSLPRRLKRFECCQCAAFHEIGSYQEVFDLLLACNPSIALRAIRLTRPKDVKSDADETNRDRKRVIERCHRLLGKAVSA